MGLCLGSVGSRVGAALALCGTAVLLSGCNIGGYREGGGFMSLDAHTYISRAWEPKTISLIETSTGETLWSVDVPVGQQLTVRFFKGESEIGGDRPDLMRWGLFEEPDTNGRLGQSMPVPDKSNRRLEMSLREAPEFR